MCTIKIPIKTFLKRTRFRNGKSRQNDRFKVGCIAGAVQLTYLTMSIVVYVSL